MGGCRMRMRKSKVIQRFCMHKFVLPRKVLRNRVLLLKIISVSGKYTYYLSAHKPLFLLFQGPNSAQLNKGGNSCLVFLCDGMLKQTKEIFTSRVDWSWKSLRFHVALKNLPHQIVGESLLLSEFSVSSLEFYPNIFITTKVQIKSFFLLYKRHEG